MTCDSVPTSKLVLIREAIGWSPGWAIENMAELASVSKILQLSLQVGLSKIAKTNLSF